MTPLHDLRSHCERLLSRVVANLGSSEDRSAGLGTPAFSAPDAPGLSGYDVVREEIALRDGGHVRLVYVRTLIEVGRLWHEVVLPLATGRADLATLVGAEPVPDAITVTRRLLAGHVALWGGPGGPTRTVNLSAQIGRPVGEATTESAVSGPKAAFVERLETNISLIRGSLRDPALRVEVVIVGRRSRTEVALCYVDDIIRRELLDKARAGLEAMDVDIVRSAADLGSQLYAGTWTPFPLVEQTERPDKVVDALVSGRLAILPDGSPFALVAPTTFWRFVEDSETRVLGPTAVVFARFMRLVGLGAATGIAGLYVAATTATITILPARLALAVGASRAGVPYPPLTETLFALIIADVLVEATVQASKQVGTALTIVGTLIIGQMLVQARLASDLTLVVVAASVIGTFLTVSPALSYALRLWKYVLVFAAGLGGLSGWIAGWLILVGHLAGLESAGVPYLSPLGPVHLDELWRYGLSPLPPQNMVRRPRSWRPRDVIRARPEKTR